MKNIFRAFVLLVSALFSISPCRADDADLLRAVQVQDAAKVTELLGKGAVPQKANSDRPLMAWAAQGGNVQIVRALIDSKVELDAVDSSNETPLFKAVEYGHSEAAKELLKAKANPNAKDARGEPVIARAVKGEKADIVAALIEAGADVSYVSPDNESLALMAAQTNNAASPEIIKSLGKAKANLNISSASFTPLYYAADLGSVDLVKALLEAGADPNAKTEGGRTPLSAGIKNAEITRLLLKAKADPNLASDVGSPALIAAIESGDPDAVKALIDAGANVNVKDDRGNSALVTAQNYSKPDLAKLLKDRGATE